MEAWTESLLVALGRAGDAGAMFDRIEQSARHLGFERCAYGLRQPLPFTNPKIFMVNNYDRRWRRRYMDAGYLSVDPTVLHGRRSHIPVVWSDDLFSQVPEMWEEARSFGLSVGWAQSCFDGNGAVGLLSLSRSHEKLTQAEIFAKEPHMRWLVNIAHTALSSVLAKDCWPMSSRLTAREVEILKWTADGKTSSEAADILRISTNTVNFHVKNAISKLRVANKAAAAARAAVLGLLD